MAVMNNIERPRSRRVRKVLMTHAQLGQLLEAAWCHIADDIVVVGVHQDVKMVMREELYIYIDSGDFMPLAESEEPRVIEIWDTTHE